MSDTSLFILTGASRGLGAALAQALMQPGRRLICVARGDNAELRAQAAAAGVTLDWHQVDLSDAHAAEAWMTKTLAALPAFANVTLVLNALGATPRRWLERWAMGAGAALAILFAVYAVRLVLQSHEFNDMSTSNDATPLWIPQLSMAVGAVVFAIAAIDEFIIEWNGRAPVADGEMLRHE